MALSFTLLAFLALRRPGTRWLVVSCVLFTLGMLCKESVIFLPLLALIADRSHWRRAVPLLGIGAIFAVLFFFLRPSGLAPDRVVYAMEPGLNVVHNLMTYTSWAIEMRDPLPDLVSSHDVETWRRGVLFLISVIAIGATLRPSARLAAFGLFWWVVGLAPVLPLQFQTYRHYMYPAIPGLALTVAAIVHVGLVRLVAWLRTLARAPGSGAPIAATILVALALAYAVRSRQLISARIAARVPGTDVALDSVTRRREVAQAALSSMSGVLPAQGPIRIAILSPEGTGRLFGARTGRYYPGGRGYNLLIESLDQGAAVKLFFPQVDSVAFINQWTPAYEGYELFLPFQNGSLLYAGRGLSAHSVVARFMLEQEWYPQLRDHLRAALVLYPTGHQLRLAYGAAQARLGEKSAALAELDRVLASAHDDSTRWAAQAAKEALESP